jgi:hypothetical protein
MGRLKLNFHGAELFRWNWELPEPSALGAMQHDV